MGIRAYKIIELKYEDTPSFNFWDNSELMEFIEPYFSESLGEDGGLLELSQEDIEKALKEAHARNASPETCKLLQKMLTDATQSEDSLLRYWCF